MSLHDRTQDLKAQILETEYMLSLVQGHPLMEPSLRERLKMLQEELGAIPNDIEEAKLRLLFSGKAVVGSLGIRSDFVNKTIKPIQGIVKSLAALGKYGNLGKRGKAKDVADLYLTNLAHGSFGYELSVLSPKELFEEQEVAKSIKQTMCIIEATTKGNEEFDKAIENIPNRVLNNLESFFKEVSDEDSILKLESGSTYIELSSEKIKEGYNRVASITIEKSPISIKGVFKGALIQSEIFEFLPEKGKVIRGSIGESLSSEDITRYNEKFSNKECIFLLQENTVIFNNHRKKPTYELLGIKPVS